MMKTTHYFCGFTVVVSFLLTVLKIRLIKPIVLNSVVQEERTLRRVARDDAKRDDEERHHSLFEESLAACTRDDDQLYTKYKPCAVLINKRIIRWKYYGPVLHVANDKLGAYYIASKLGVRSPLIKFCGTKHDLPQDIESSLGTSYVIKPMDGYSAKGVQVVINGVDIFKGKNVTYDSLQARYDPTAQLVVEEVIESSDTKFKGKIPPDYKFHVSRGVREYADAIDRNLHCAHYITFGNHTDEWKTANMQDDQYHWCEDEDHFSLDQTRQSAMMKAVDKLATFTTAYMRIDMFDSKNGPVLGEFTPFASKGHTLQLEGCVRTRMFIEHAKHGGVNDDTVLLGVYRQSIKNKLKKESDKLTPLEQSNYQEVLDLIPEDLKDFTIAEERSPMFQDVAMLWESYTQLEKCKKVMEAQKEMLFEKEQVNVQYN